MILSLLVAFAFTIVNNVGLNDQIVTKTFDIIQLYHYDTGFWEILDLKKTKNLHCDCQRHKIEITFNLDECKESKNYSLQLNSIFSAYVLYFDSIRISENGKLANNKQEELIGSLYNIVDLPSNLMVKGIHRLTLDISNFHFPDEKTIGSVKLSESQFWFQKFLKQSKMLISFISIYSILFIIALIYYYNLQKLKSYLYISAYCFLITSYLLIILYWYEPSTNLVMFYYGTIIQQALFFLSQLTLVSFFLYFYEIKEKYKYMAIIIPVLFISEYVKFFNLNSALTVLSHIIIPAFIALSSSKRNQYRILMFFAYLVYCFGIIYFKLIHDIWWVYFSSNSAFVCLMIAVAVKKWREEKNKHADSILKSSRLESQLLKTNIRPHFLMNSLISIQELLYENPSKASEFIDSLSEEFYLFTKLSNEKLVSIKDELKICEAHLKIMSYRKSLNLNLIVEGVKGDELVPPAIFHTLIENGISHGFWKKREGFFKISKKETANEIIYRVFNNGENTISNKNKSTGTGLKYIISRLEESYQKEWQIFYGPTPEGWETNIIISKVLSENLLEGSYENINC